MWRSWFVSFWCFSLMCTRIWREELKRSGPHFRLFVIAPLVNWMLVWSVNSARARGSLSKLLGLTEVAIWKKRIYVIIEKGSWCVNSHQKDYFGYFAGNSHGHLQVMLMLSFCVFGLLRRHLPRYLSRSHKAFGLPVTIEVQLQPSDGIKPKKHHYHLVRNRSGHQTGNFCFVVT